MACFVRVAAGLLNICSLSLYMYTHTPICCSIPFSVSLPLFHPTIRQYSVSMSEAPHCVYFSSDSSVRPLAWCLWSVSAGYLPVVPNEDHWAPGYACPEQGVALDTPPTQQGTNVWHIFSITWKHQRHWIELTFLQWLGRLSSANGALPSGQRYWRVR